MSTTVTRPRTSAEIRRAFLEFFEQRGHARVPSSSLVPADDPTLLFTNAGMVQFKDVFTGQRQVPYRRATTAQKCVRAGGKHNDLENVGKTARHHTFFEMLGNFSFGDYFKREAITFAWELVTEVFGLPMERLWATVYREDDEAAQLWQEIAGLPADRIVRLGEKDNFWAMGDTGPCGPCSEILIDRGARYACDAPECGIGKCDCDRWLEIWNLVFMQFERGADGTLTPLPKPSVDTGMGLERIASVLQDVDTNWDTDLFLPLLRRVEQLSGRAYDRGPAGFPFRVIADHARACTFLIADGVVPSNEGRGHVLRRILRRAVRFGRKLGLDRPFLCDMVPAVVDVMGEAYPEIAGAQEFVQSVIRQEEERFGQTLEQGMQLLDELVEEAKRSGRGQISGEDAFRLYDTYGFPLDLTVDAAEEAGLTVDRDGFEAVMQEQRRRARADWQAKIGAATRGGEWAESLPPTEFVGYDRLAAEAEVVAIAADGAGRPEAREGERVLVVLSSTPFYAESGGQVGDTGWLEGPAGRARVEDTRKEAGVFLHAATVTEGRLAVGDVVQARVDENRRRDIMRNHSATHLLHRALKDVLGEHANQAGSLVAPDRLRFDFTALAAPSPDQLAEVEARVNEAVLAAHPVQVRHMKLDEAKAMGAMALFGEKYGEIVRVVSMGPSIELCGGTHVRNTAEVGLFVLTSEGSVGSGVRRVEAVTGRGAYDYVKRREALLSAAAEAVKAPVEELPAKVEDLMARLKERERELAALRAQAARGEADRLAATAEPVHGVPVVFAEVRDYDADGLRTLADHVRDRLRSGGVVLAARVGERAMLLATFTRDVVERGAHAGEVVARAARAIGGGGGGRPDFAQAGGRDATRLADALKAAREAVSAMLGSA
ncbi:MAG: alanine--tRNA ligase [Clostridia bacterium]|nr:alanine--tRNA ligase [Clostridia bacterium]